MRVSYNIIKKYVDIKEDPYKLAEKLTHNGLEVEKIEEYSFEPNKFIVGQILKIEKHPNADKLTLCTVDIGEKTLKIICGAKNHKENDKVVVALEGAKLPNGLEIKKTKLRGIESEGMLCSKSELALEEKSEGIWILDKDIKVGSDIKKIIPEKDYIFHISITSNRSDCLCAIGIAREAGIIEGKNIEYPKYKIIENKNIEKPDITIQNSRSCHRYVSRIIKNVKVTESPDWLKEELIKMGSKPINNIVDITNYIMLHLGHPMHAFDYDKLDGKKIIVRNAKKGEKITGLDGKEYELYDDILIISDSNKPVAIAGVIGGENSKVDEKTTNILLESAYFIPKAVRNSSKKLGIKTDSSYRFERDMDPDNTIKALNYATYLIQEITGAEVSEITDVYPLKNEERTVDLKTEFINNTLGFEIKTEDIEKIFKLLEFNFKKTDDGYNVTFPTFRRDCYRDIDAVEEIIRVYGYSNIKETIRPIRLDYESFTSKLPIDYKIREILSNSGLYEAYNFSFASPEEVKRFNLLKEENIITIRNPISPYYSTMRTSMAPGLFNNLNTNIDKGNQNILFFEIGKIFYKDKEEIKEEKRLGIIGTGLLYKNWLGEEKIDFYLLKGIIDKLLSSLNISSEYKSTDNINFLHPYKTANILHKDYVLGFIGEINPYISGEKTIVYAEINLEIIREIISSQKKLEYREISKYPAVRKELSFVMDKNVNASIVIDEIKKNQLVQSVDVLDVYTSSKIGENKKSVTFSFVLQALDHTFTDEEINSIMKKVIDEVAKKGIALRDK